MRFGSDFILCSTFNKSIFLTPMEYYLFLSWFFSLLLFCHPKNATKTINQKSAKAVKMSVGKREWWGTLDFDSEIGGETVERYNM